MGGRRAAGAVPAGGDPHHAHPARATRRPDADRPRSRGLRKNSSTPTSPTPSTSGPTRVIGLSGSLAFGEVAVGGQRDLTFTIPNTGTQALTVTGMTVTGGLSAHTTATWTNGTIASGASQSVTVRSAPTTAGSYTGTLTVNGDQTSGTNTLPISGTATAPSFQGTWAGRYVIDRCDGTGSIQDLLCSSNRGLFPPGTSLPISMTFTQNGNTVSERFAFGQVTASATASSAGRCVDLQGRPPPARSRHRSRRGTRVSRTARWWAASPTTSASAPPGHRHRRGAAERRDTAVAGRASRAPGGGASRRRSSGRGPRGAGARPRARCRRHSPARRARSPGSRRGRGSPRARSRRSARRRRDRRA